jgi:hypothetical protein
MQFWKFGKEKINQQELTYNKQTNAGMESTFDVPQILSS